MGRSGKGPGHSQNPSETLIQTFLCSGLHKERSLHQPAILHTHTEDLAYGIIASKWTPQVEYQSFLKDFPLNSGL